MAQARTDSTAPLARRPVSARRDPPARSTVTQAPYDAEKMMTAGAKVNAALREICGRVERITGLLVATRDGLVLCSATHGIEDHNVAAMAAAANGLATQFTGQANVGPPRATTFEGMSGQVCVFPVEGSILLVVFGEPDITMGLFNSAAKQALSLLRQAIFCQQVDTVRDTSQQ